MKKNLKKILALLVYFYLPLFGFRLYSWIYYFSIWKFINKEIPQVPESDMSIFGTLGKPEKIILGATRGLIESLEDPYSDFLTAKQTKELSEELSGEFFGVGMEIGKQDGYIVVIAPLPGTPAEEAGIKPNDIILAIEETDTVDLSTTEAAQLIRGKLGTKVTLTVYRSAWNEAKK